MNYDNHHNQKQSRFIIAFSTYWHKQYQLKSHSVWTDCTRDEKQIGIFQIVSLSHYLDHVVLFNPFP